MFKSILQTNIRTCSIRQGFARFLTSSTSKAAGSHVPAASTVGSQLGARGPAKLQVQPTSVHRSSENPPHNASRCPDTLTQVLSRLSLSPEEVSLTAKYRLPSSSASIRDAILDPVANVAIPFDCPTSINQDFVDAPAHERTDVSIIEDPVTNVTKKASNIMQKRHKKMKRHQYLKWRKRNRFKLRIQKQKRRKRQRKRWERHLNRFRFTDLKPSEGEQYLKFKESKLKTYLNYLGVQVDDISTEDKELPRERKRGPSRIIRPGGTGQIIPQPILPEGAQLR